MRAPFNTTCDVFFGPGSATPGALRGTCQARFVPAHGVSLTGPGAPLRVAWVTMQAVKPQGAWTRLAFGYDPGLGDQVAVPAGGLKQWWVLFVEEISWRNRERYYRANIVLLPLPRRIAPPPPGAPGRGGLWCPEAGGVEVGRANSSPLPPGGVEISRPGAPPAFSGGVLIGGL